MQVLVWVLGCFFVVFLFVRWVFCLFWFWFCFGFINLLGGGVFEGGGG